MTAEAFRKMTSEIHLTFHRGGLAYFLKPLLKAPRILKIWESLSRNPRLIFGVRRVVEGLQF
jgi:hypothetical protein